MEVITIGLDLAKNVYQVHGADAFGSVVFRKRLRRDKVLSFFAVLPPCTVGDGSLWRCAPLGTPAQQGWPYGSSDPGGLRKALCKAAKERCR